MSSSNCLVCVGLFLGLATQAMAHQCPEPLPISLGANGLFYWDSEDQAPEAPRLATPAPVWMPWQSLYTGTEVNRTRLQERAHLTDEEVEMVFAQGKLYVRELELIDEQARAEVSERYGPEFPHQIFASDMGLSREWAEEPYTPPFTRDGRPLKLAMAADGFTAKIEARKYAAYRSHWEALAEAIGLYKLVLAEAFVDSELASYMRVLPQGVSPTEMPPMLREFVEFLRTRPTREQKR